ncbi:MAG: tRNA (adenosine(37)-N6)-threonylcarbamoyltransferase complex transferase subunit TsaD [Dehalococcoidia bacterium]|nr:MAG: tRNA (adenosine(37)-N6)-threonylcarbamoyltransferase complex transferase subunit TsaD [Dehalococcoidia bacterium]
MKILGVESSCDETAAAVVEDGVRILSNEIASQVDIHARYGGVVPEVASRQHLLAIVPIIRQAMDKALTTWQDIDAIAVTHGPGLAGSLLVGVSAAKAVAFAQGIRLMGINHLEAHIYANWLGTTRPEFPLLCLIVSGGHTDLVLMRGHGDYTLLGKTRDDAAGEAFDKAARILGLGYPGGPAIDRASQNGKPCLDLPHAWLAGTHDFSFSGIKTALYRMVEDDKISNANDAAASFQEAVVSILAVKTIAAAKEHGVKQILMSGGVASNRLLRQRLSQESPMPVLIPEPVLCTDNAAMVAACGYFRLQTGKSDGLDMDVIPGLRLF